MMNFGSPSDIGDLSLKPGVSPITQQGRVALNAFKDNELVDLRRANNDKAFYRASDTRDHIFTILQGEVVLAERQRLNLTNTAMGRVLKGLSALNGLGDQSQTKDDLIEEMTFLGLSQMKYEHRSEGVGDDTSIVMVRGGRFSIPHTGFEKINAGDLVYWDLPDPAQGSTAYGASPKGKIVALTRPYRPGQDGVSKNAVYARLNGVVAQTGRATRRTTTGMAMYAESFLQGLLSASLVVHQLIRDEYAGADARQLEKLAGLVVSNDAAATKQFRQRVIDLVFGPQAEAQNLRVWNQFSDDGKKKMRCAPDNLISGIEGQINFVKRRIFAEATSPGIPGRTFDVLPLNYSN